MAADVRNTLYYGDNLDVLRRHVKDESIDLVYLDPPFNSNATYNVLFREHDDTPAPSQIEAFEDTWHWDQSAAEAYQRVVEQGGRVADGLQAFRTFIPESDMLAYLAMMAPRLVELHRVLKPSGSIYLHCDPTASHYLKMLMDAVFGADQFRNEIIWRRTGSHNSPRRFGPIHDTLLFYSKSNAYYFKTSYRPYLAGHVEGYFKQKDDDGRAYWMNALTGAGTRKGQSGLPWRHYNPTPLGRHWAIPGKVFDELGLDPTMSTQDKLDALDAAGFIAHPGKASSAMPTYRQYLDASPGMPIQDIWSYQPHTHGALALSKQAIDEDVRWLRAQGDSERLGYPTQKPRGLLERVVRSSCPEGGIVLDPFCGCGTTIAASQNLGRTWVGIDITHLAINLIKVRLADSYGLAAGTDYDVLGEPTDLPGAAELAAENPWQFQAWALGLVGARTATSAKKGSDKGIDGRILFHDEGGASTKTKQIILSVKAGGTNVAHVRDLVGVLQREGAQIGVLLTMQEPTQPMRAEAASAGFYKSPWGGSHPRVQLITVEDALAGKQIDYPSHVTSTFKEAPKVEEDEGPPQEEKLFE